MHTNGVIFYLNVHVKGSCITFNDVNDASVNIGKFVKTLPRITSPKLFIRKYE